MFRNRQSSQKPPDELFERFRQSFPGVRAGSTSGPSESHLQTAGGLHDSTLNQPRFGHDHEDLEPTPKAPSEPFRFTPSLLDPTSAAFAAFANQPPGLFTPTPAGTNTVYNQNHNDLQTPNVGINAGPPLSLPNTTVMAPPTTSGVGVPDYDPQTIQPHQFHNYHPFSQPLQPHFLDPTQYAQPSPGPGSPMDLGDGGGEILPEPRPLEGSVMGPTQLLALEGKQYDHELGPIASSERFRFHVVLNAPTAMIKHPDEIPVTYLNKGQAYAISILDTTPPPSAGPMRYRTYIRISFHDETQRSRPASCWQLWKEGRGTNEAHQRGGKLQAVEYVEASSQPDDDKKKGRVDIETASFDSFAVIWSPSPSGSPETSVSVRFNFLSTDFSHSKGVKGIPVRLCAKTEVLSSGSPQSPPEQSEICFCKVKLFRDHGAERKLANDILHVKKTIEKLKQQANQVEGTGMKVFGKKSKKDEDSGKPGKALKHKRTWSMSSASSVGGGRTQEEDTNVKLASMQDMFTSTRAVSVLYLRGSDIDDPDLHPVHLPGEMPELLEDVWARRRSSVATTNTTASSFVSPTSSSASQSSQHGDAFNSLERRDWEREYQPLPPPQQPHHPGGSDDPVRVKPDPGMLSGWIEAIGIDSSYNPPPERPVKPVMAIYILPTPTGSPPQANQYYRAVYLQARNSSCLAASIASKCGIDPSAVLRTVHVNPRGLTILVDDEFVREMPEGQDMKVQAIEIREESPFASPPQESEGKTGAVAKNGWELRLMY